ncbi:HlyD family secretion protein [Thermocoleostomius sinensis]|uniref:HlyD family secretion protein n=1 Tax=Thermocoleostomius sinensis A174 TaxID=2016057 RepID=A0A9E8ZJX3_9CYAN|nr:HlyD family secretion protein [Thermocoleostomius sinensis]WAL59861.1 HlyD family secretion protein [Thermocoleostomius sinensis A174]
MQSNDHSALNRQTGLNGKSALGKASITSEQLSVPSTKSTPETTELETPDSATKEEATLEPPEPPIEPRRKHPPKWAIGLIVVGAIVAGSWGLRWWHYASTHEETDNAQVVGNIYPISSRIPGTVQTIAVDDNQPVQAGQVLVQLDPHDYQVKVEQAQAALAVAQRQAQAAQAGISLANANAQAQTTTAQGSVGEAIASISSAQAALKEAQAGVPFAQAQLAQSEANLQKAQTDDQRYETLYQQGAISAQQRDAARANYETAAAAVDANRQQVQQSQAKVAQAQQGIAQAQAQLQSSQGGIQQAQATGVQAEVNRSQYDAAVAQIAEAKAALQNAQLQLSYTQITAPATGRVGNKTVEVGQQVQPGQPLMAVVGTAPWIAANFKETQVARMHPGEAVEIHIDAFPSQTFVGRIASLSPASGAQFSLLPPDNATGNFTKVVQRIPVKITFDPSSIQPYENAITAGMSATVSVAVE